MRPRPILAILALTGLLPLAATAADDSRLTVHAAPKPLAEDAVTAPWPRFLGPADNGTTTDAPIAGAFPESGPVLLWELDRGTGYAAPAVADGQLFLFHRLDDAEVLECRDPETGALHWTESYPIEYRDRYGYSNGPRAGPLLTTLSDDRAVVFTFGVTGVLTCRECETGAAIWKREINKEFDVPKYFFGSGPSPIVVGDLLIQNVGGDACVAAFDTATGATRWTLEDAWGASYASPVAGSMHGKPLVFVFAGGESDPATGGLLAIDPTTGKLHDRFAWRADKYESVNAATPLIVDDSHIFISECYQKGGVLLRLTEDLKFEVAWEAPDFGMHWMTPILNEGHLYGFRGRNEPDAFLTCYEVATGEEKWRETLTWKEEIDGRSFGWGFFRGTILAADGKFLAFGEMGTLAYFDLSPKGVTVEQKAQLFRARSSWTLPSLHRGLLYVSQNEPDLVSEQGRRLLCYDLRP